MHQSKQTRSTKLPFTLLFKAIEMGVSTDIILDKKPPQNFKDFVTKHFSAHLSFESESIKSDSSFEDLP